MEVDSLPKVFSCWGVYIEQSFLLSAVSSVSHFPAVAGVEVQSLESLPQPFSETFFRVLRLCDLFFVQRALHFWEIACDPKGDSVSWWVLHDLLHFPHLVVTKQNSSKSSWVHSCPAKAATRQEFACSSAARLADLKEPSSPLRGSFKWINYSVGLWSEVSKLKMYSQMIILKWQKINRSEVKP